MPAVLARGALDYLLPRLSMEGKEPKSLVLPLSSTIHPIPQRTFSPTRKTFGTFVTGPTIVRYLEIVSLEIFFFTINFSPLFLSWFHVSFSFFSSFFLYTRRTRHFFPLSASQACSTPPHPGSLTVPPRSPLTPSPSPAPSPSSLAASVWRWPELINNSRLWVSFGDSQLDLEGARSNYLRSPAEEECSLSAQHVQIIFDWREGGKGEKVLLLEGGKYCSPSLLSDGSGRNDFLADERISFVSPLLLFLSFLRMFCLAQRRGFKIHVRVSFFFFF